MVTEEKQEVVEQEVQETPEQESFDRESFIKGEATTEETQEEVVDEKEIQEEVVTETLPDKKEQHGSEIDDYWSVMQSTLSTDETPYEVPEFIKTGKDKEGKDLSKEDKFKLFTNEVLKNASYSQNPSIDGYVRNLLSSATQEGFNLESHIKQFSEQVNTNSLPVDERLFMDAKEKYGKKGEDDTIGMTDDDIKDEIAKMGKFQKIDAIKKIDENINVKLSDQNKANIEDYNTKFDSSISKVKTEDESLLSNYIKRIKGAANIDGIELGEADHAQFIKDLPSFFEKKVETNTDGFKYVTSEVEKQLAGLLGSPENSMHLLPFLWMAKNGKLQGYTSSVKEAAKKKVEDKFVNNIKSEKELSVTTEYDPKRFREGE